MKTPKIYFYISTKDCPERTFPNRIEDYWTWMQSVKIKFPGAESWILQTYLQLKTINFPCEFTTVLPDEGIVIAHPFSLPFDLKPNPNVLLICTRDDKKPHPYAQLHIVQNRKQSQPQLFGSLWKSYYIPLWTQTGLIPRNPDRCDRFENIAYLGDLSNLAPELRTPDWAEHIEKLGCRWLAIGDTELWNNYSELDAVIAIRSFGKNLYKNKPASKLFNAWRSQVPAILGRETAYQAERKSKFDYLEANSVAQVLSAVIKLRDDKAFRQSMIENGNVRSQEIETDSIRDRWQNFLLDIAVPAYDRWRSKSHAQQTAFLQSRQFIYFKLDGLSKRGITQLEL